MVYLATSNFEELNQKSILSSVFKENEMLTIMPNHIILLRLISNFYYG